MTHERFVKGKSTWHDHVKLCTFLRGSFLHEGRVKMNERHIKNGTSTKTDWDRFHSMTDEEIEQAAKSDPDAQPTDAEFWTDAQSVFPVEDQEVVQYVM